MVSNLTSVFRRKNQEKENKKAKNGILTPVTVTSSSDEAQKVPAMVLTPPVTNVQEIKIESDKKDTVEIPKSDKKEEEGPSNVPLSENVSNGNGSTVSAETSDNEIDQLINVLKAKVAEGKDILLNLWDNVKTSAGSLRNEIPDDFGSVWSIICIVAVLFFTFFTMTSFVRAALYTHHGQDQGWFCRHFAVPFSPLFNALCETEHIHFVHRLTLEMWNLADEIGLGISNFFATVASGFTVFGTIFSAIWSGIAGNLSFGCHELGENLGENIAHLLHFFVRIFHLICHVIFSTIATIAGGVAGTAASIHDYFQPPESFFGLF